MKKVSLIFSIMVLGMATVFLSGCMFPRATNPSSSISSSQSGQVPSGSDNSGSSVIVTPPTSEKCAPAENFLAELEKANTFKIVTCGKVDSDVANQTIDSEKIKSKDEYYYYTKSVSSNPLVSNSEHTAFYAGDKVVYDKKTSPTKLAAYKSEFGTTPMDHAIEGIIINDNTLENVSSKTASNGSITYTLTIKNCNEAAKNVRTQMKKNAGLKDIDFKSITIYLTVDKNGLPLISDLECTYIATKSVVIDIKSNCSQTLHSVYTLNGSVTIPNRDKYVPIINK